MMDASAENHASFGLRPEALRAGQWPAHLERSRGGAVSRLEPSELNESETRGVVAAESAPAVWRASRTRPQYGTSATRSIKTRRSTNAN